MSKTIPYSNNNKTNHLLPRHRLPYNLPRPFWVDCKLYVFMYPSLSTVDTPSTTDRGSGGHFPCSPPIGQWFVGPVEHAAKDDPVGNTSAGAPHTGCTQCSGRGILKPCAFPVRKAQKGLRNPCVGRRHGHAPVVHAFPIPPSRHTCGEDTGCRGCNRGTVHGETRHQWGGKRHHSGTVPYGTSIDVSCDDRGCSGNP